mgnify:FL=1
MNIITKLMRHELISGSFYIFLGSMFSNVLAFFLNLFLARNLSYADYAVFASLLSVITLASIPAGSINTIIVKFATDYFVKKQSEKLKRLYVVFFKFILGLSLGVFFLFLALANPLKQYLHLSDIWYVIVSGLVISVFYLSTLNIAFLQSLLKFKTIALVNIVGGVVKLVIGIILIFLGYRAFGGLWAIFFMTFGMFIFGFIPLKRIILSKSSQNLSLNLKNVLGYAIPAFITVLFLTSFTTVDVILVKHFFEPNLAGYYAGLSLMGKVIFYFTFPIPMVMFPLLIKRHTNKESFTNLFYLALLLVLIPSFIITAFYFLFPEFVINLFLGGRNYLFVAPYLGIFGILLTVFSMVNVCVNFFLSFNKTSISFFVVSAAILQIVLIYIFHSSFYQVIGASFLVLIILLIILFYIFFKNYGNFGKLKETIAVLNNPTV